jgi:hypothetical protein
VKRNSGNHEHSFQLCTISVRAEVSCPIADLQEKTHDNPLDFAQRFVQAVQIAEVEPLEL